MTRVTLVLFSLAKIDDAYQLDPTYGNLLRTNSCTQSPEDPDPYVILAA
jgi:hypothetical protein